MQLQGPTPERLISESVEAEDLTAVINHLLGIVNDCPIERVEGCCFLRALLCSQAVARDQDD